MIATACHGRYFRILDELFDIHYLVLYNLLALVYYLHFMIFSMKTSLLSTCKIEESIRFFTVRSVKSRPQ